MNQYIFLPLLFTLLIVLTWLGARRLNALAPLRRQLKLLLIILLISLVIFLLNTPLLQDLSDFSDTLHIVWLLLIFLIMVLAIRLIRFVLFDWLIGRQAKERRLKLVEDLSVVILYAIGILLIADNYLKIQITPVLATSAIITIVAGFALQNVLGDLFAGLALNFDESLHIGDWIRFGTIEGRIEQLRWRSMKIRTRDGYLVVVPNQNASRETVTVLGGTGGGQTAVTLTLGVSYDNEPDQVMDLIRRKVAQLEGIIPKAPVDIWISSFDDFAVTYTIRYRISDPARMNRSAGELRHHLWYAFKRYNFTIPYPIRTVISARERETRPGPELIMPILRANEILSVLPENRLEDLAGLSRLLVFGKDEQIIREDEEGKAFHLILSGDVSVSRRGQPVTSLSRGDYFGEMSLFTGEKTSASVTAESECRIIRISAQDFKDLIAMNEEIARAVSGVIARRRARNLEQDEEKSKHSQSRIRSESASIFQRIKRYFELSTGEPDQH